MPSDDLGTGNYMTIHTFDTEAIAGTVTVTNGCVSTVTVTATVPLRTRFFNEELYRELTEPPHLPQPYDGPPRNRHERRAAAKR